MTIPKSQIFEFQANQTNLKSRFHVLGIIGKVLLVLMLPLAGPNGHILVYVFLAVWASFGPRRAIEALSLTWLATFLNPGIYALSSMMSLLRWMVLYIAFLSIVYSLIKQRKSIPKFLVWLCWFTFVLSVFAPFVSYAPDVSIFKLVNFFVAAGIILVGFHLTRNQADYWRSWFLGFFTVILMVGFPLLFHPLGFFRNSLGFQGILNHPQAYGIFLAPFLAWVLALKISRQLHSTLWWAVIGLAVVSLVATGSRTAVMAGGVGLSVGFIVAWVRDTKFRAKALGSLIKLVPVLFMILIYGIIHNQKIIKGIQDFMYKGGIGNYSDITDSFHHSRGFLIDQSWERFLENPVLGIGFGVASDPLSFRIDRDTILGLPISAPTEKGWVLFALLEEVGVIGFFLFTVAMMSILYPVFQKRALAASGVLVMGALSINFGEAVLFAIGGMGMLVWLWFGLARVTVQLR